MREGAGASGTGVSPVKAPGPLPQNTPYPKKAGRALGPARLVTSIFTQEGRGDPAPTVIIPAYIGSVSRVDSSPRTFQGETAVGEPVS